MLYWHTLMPWFYPSRKLPRIIHPSIRTIRQVFHSEIEDSSGKCPAINKNNKPLNITSALRSCNTRRSLWIAHHEILINGQDQISPFLLNLVIGLYGKFGSLQESRCVFKSLQHKKNVYSWTSIIDVFAQHGQPKESLNYYKSMLKEGLKPDRILCLCMIGVCSTLLDLERGKEVHSFIDNADLKDDVVMKTALVNMYSKCGNLSDAIAVFELSEERDSILYGAIIVAYNQFGFPENAICAYDRMVLEGVKPTEYAVVAFLGSCGMSSSLVRSKALHSCLMYCGYESDIVLGTSLINTYNKCGSLSDAANVFRSLSHGDTILWNTMITIYTQHGHETEALLLYQEMMKQGLEPSQVTFVCSLCAVTEPCFLSQGNLIHAQIIEYNFEMNAYVVTALISMYTRCGGTVRDAQYVFDRVSIRNVESWTVLIASYLYHGHVFEAFQFYQQMLTEGVSPDRCAFTTVLMTCFCPESLSKGKQIHARALNSFGFDQDVELQTSLISMYGKCGSAEDAEKVFGKARTRNVGLWNSLMATYMQVGDARKALELYKTMQTKGVFPDNVTFATILTACSVTTDLPEGKKIHESIRKAGLQADVIIGTSLVNMYAKCGDLTEARDVFARLHGRNDISWNAMIAVYANRFHAHTNNSNNEAFCLFKHMCGCGFEPDVVTFISILRACHKDVDLSHGELIHASILDYGFESNSVICTALLNMYGRCDALEFASILFHKLQPCRETIPWNAIIAAYSQQGYHEDALEFFYDMERCGITPDKVTFISVVTACANLHCFDEGKRIHLQIRDYGFDSDVVVCNALITMYGNCVATKESRIIFDRMPCLVHMLMILMVWVPLIYSNV
mgnify:CR=1 FL=1